MKYTTSILIGTLVFLALLAVLAFYLDPHATTFEEWLGRDTTFDGVMAQMSYGLAFGIIDSTLLMIGVDGLVDLYSGLPGGASKAIGPLYGNLYSSVVSGFGSAFIGDAISSRISAKGPFWARPVGLFLGCSTVIMTRLTLRKQSK